MSRKVKAALDRKYRADDALDGVLAAEYPIGADIEWVKGYHPPQSGSVVMHGYGGRIKVENRRTGRQLWVRAYDICEAM